MSPGSRCGDFPDGKHVCFNIYRKPEAGLASAQIPIAAHGSKRSRLVASKTQYNGLISADPRIRHLRLYIHNELVKLDLRSGRITALPPTLRKYVGEIFW